MDAAACQFGYRDSVFKRPGCQLVIVDVTFALPRRWQANLGYAELAQELAAQGLAAPGARQVAEAVIAIRRRKLPDPAVIGNAGSFFKNPIIDAALADALQQAHPGLPAWPQPGGRCKISAAWMIEAAGFKGLREGDAGISNRHALVLVNHGSASGPQLWALAQRVMTGVHDRFGVQLEPEPVVIAAG